MHGTEAANFLHGQGSFSLETRDVGLKAAGGPCIQSSQRTKPAGKGLRETKSATGRGWLG